MQEGAANVKYRVVVCGRIAEAAQANCPIDAQYWAEFWAESHPKNHILVLDMDAGLVVFSIDPKGAN